MPDCVTPPDSIVPPVPSVPASLVAVSPDHASPADTRREQRLHAILHGPVLPTLMRLGLPTISVLLAQTVVSVAETYWTSLLGTNALAGVALVFPFSALMTAVSNSGIGGGVSSAVARALGAGKHDEAEALTFHAVLLAVIFGLFFMVASVLFGPLVFRAMGGSGDALRAALLFSGWFFAGSVPIWVVNLLAAALRGAGEVKLPALVTLIGAAVVIPLSPALIFGWGPLPRMGVGGAGLAVSLYFTGAMLVLVRLLLRGQGSLRLRLVKPSLGVFRSILKVGLVSAFTAVTSNVTILLVTGAVGFFGVDALAGYGIASRLDWLLIPLLFGLGTAVVTMVGASTGAGNHARARKIAWTASLLAFGVVELIGLFTALLPQLWMALFTTHSAVLQAGAHYLRIVAPAYGVFGMGLMLSFACQGRARMFWPFVAGLARLSVAAGGGLLLAHLGHGMRAVFGAVAGGSIVFGALNAYGMFAGGKPTKTALSKGGAAAKRRA